MKHMAFAIAACVAVLAPSISSAEESYGEMERRLYLKPETSPLEKPARSVVFQDGDFETPRSDALSLDGEWSVRLQDGRTIRAEVPCSIYTALWKAGVTGDPYFGTNDLFAATFSGQTSVWSRVFAFSPRAGARYRLSFEGVTDEAEFTLNGKPLGRHLGMFGGPDFVLDAAELGDQNTLEVRLLPVRKMSDTVSCQCVRGGHYCNLPSIGIWRSVSMREIPDAEVRRQFVVTRSAEGREMDYRVDIDAAKEASGELRLSVRPVGFAGKCFRFSERVDLKPGENALRYSFALPGAELWRPAGHGEARTYEITASFGGSSRTDAFGIRTFRFVPGPDGAKTNLYNRVAEVNGRQLFIKGAGWCTCDALLRLDEAMYRRMIGRATEQGVNFFRAWGLGIVETDEFYRQCDRNGIMVLQEFPVPGKHSNPDIHQPLLDTAVRSVERLRNHPSLAVWGGGNELGYCNNEPCLGDKLLSEIGRICCELDGTRDFWRTDPWAGSEHHHISWSGWTPDRFLMVYAERYGVCQNEYGLDTLMNVESLRRISPPEEHDMFPWRHFTAMAHHTATFNYDYIAPRAMRPKGRDVENFTWFGSLYYPQTDLASFVLSSQIAQVYATACHVYNARTQFPRTGMYIYYKLNDVFPGSSWAVVDWFGAPKLAHYTLKRAQRTLCAAPRLEGHEFGADAQVPLYILDDAGELRGGSRWEVTARFYNAGLEMTAERRFAGTGPVGQVRKLGEAASDPARPLTSPSVLTWELAVDGEVRARDFAMVNVYENPRKCGGFARTELKARVDGRGRCVVTNVGKSAAVGVMLDLGKGADDAVLEDNFFFLPAGESRAIAVSPADAVKGVSALNAPAAQVSSAAEGEQCSRRLPPRGAARSRRSARAEQSRRMPLSTSSAPTAHGAS